MVSKQKTGRAKGRPRNISETDSLTQDLLKIQEKDIPAPPSYFEDDEDALLFWASVYQIPYITEADRFQVELAAQIWSEYQSLRRAFRMGMAKRTITNANRIRSASPELKDLRETRVELNGALSSLGITPTDRARLQVDEQAAELALKAMLAENNKRREERRKAAKAAKKNA